MALARDVPFSEYATNSTARAAAAELSRLPDFRGPKIGGVVTHDILFSGFTAGDLVGPYISQFLWKPAEFGVEEITQKFRSLRHAGWLRDVRRAARHYNPVGGRDARAEGGLVPEVVRAPAPTPGGVRRTSPQPADRRRQLSLASECAEFSRRA